MDQTHFDLVVIGGGPGGYGAALYGASAGLSVAVVERDKVGGTCLHRGCIPAKEFLETAAVVRTVKSAGDFGVVVEPKALDWPVVLERKRTVIDRLFGGLSQLLKGRKVTVLSGTGTLGADRTVTVVGAGGERATITGDAVVLASGSVPRVIPGFEPGGAVVTSDEFFEISQVPYRSVVIGGGAIGCEFASTLADLGSQVTMLEALPKILPGCDEDVTRVVGQSFKKKGIEVRTGVSVEGHTPNAAGGTTVHLADGESVDCELVVVSVGRRPLTDGLLEPGTGVQLSDRGHVDVDDHYRTHAPGVYAIGDVIDTPQLAHVAFAEAISVVQSVLGENGTPVDGDTVPWAIYCNPEVAFAGLSESAARERGLDVVSSKHRFAANSRAMIIGETEGLVKVIAERNADGTAGRIVGVHMVGPWVTEQLSGGYLAVNWEATVADVAQFLQPHPSLSELFGETVLSLTGRSLHG